MSTPGLSEKASLAQPADEKAVPRHLRCNSCSKPLFNAFQTPHGCRICQSCVLTKLHPTEKRLCLGTTEACKDENEKIHICQASCRLPDIATRREISKLTVFCPNRDGGCREQMKWREVDSHLEKCEYEKVSCEQCRDSVLKKRLRSHLSDECRQRKVPCSLCQQSVVHSEMDENLLNLEATNCDGYLVWKVSNFAQRRREAVKRRGTSLFSLPFLSQRFGFKFRVHLFLHGNESGEGSHLSVYLVLMQHEFDDIQEWPLKASVSFKMFNLRNQDDDVVKTVRFDSGNRRPSSREDLSVRCGDAKFMSINQFENSGRFVKNDSFYLEVEVTVDGEGGQGRRSRRK